MKKVKFVSGFNAKLALVACAVAGFTLTGCEKEEFSVDVPNISVDVPEITWPETQEGVAYVLLSATASTGEALNDVTFFIDDTEQEAIFAPVAAGATHTIRAEKTGYFSNEVSVAIPALPDNAVLNIPVNIVLTAINVDEDNNISVVQPTPDEIMNGDIIEGIEPDTISVPTPSAGYFPAGEVRINDVPVPTAEPFLSSEQKTEFRAAVDAYLESMPAVRALDEDKRNIRDLFYAKIDSYSESANTELKDYTITIDKDAKKIEIEVNTTYRSVNLTISVTYNGTKHPVTSECTVASASEVSGIADGVNVGHGHGHGNDDNAGGGVIE